jgi:hypothetical protein
MGASTSSVSEQLDYAEECVGQGIASRERRQYRSAQRWFEEALRIREPLLAPSTDANYSEAYVSVLVLLGEIHFWQESFEMSLFYFLKAADLLDAKLDLPSIRRTTAVTQLVNLTAGLVLVYSRLATDEDLFSRAEGTRLRDAMGGTHPLDLAELQLQRAIEVVTKIEGARSSTLIPLFHMFARVLMARRKAISAQRVMQRCLGLTLHVAQTKQVFSFLSYTRNVLDAIKKHAARDGAAITIQQWWRDQRAIRLGFTGHDSYRGSSRAASRSPTRRNMLPAVPALPQLPPIRRVPHGSLRIAPTTGRSARSDGTFASARSADTNSPPALPHSPQESGSFHREAADFADIPDILGMQLGPASPTPETQSASMPRDPLPGEVDDSGPGYSSGFRGAGKGVSLYSSMNHINRNMATAMKLWEIPPEDEFA